MDREPTPQLKPKELDIVDRLRLAYYQLKQDQGNERLADLMYEAAMLIHEMQGKVYSYPPMYPELPEGTTWQEEYHILWNRMSNMKPAEFKDWQEAMK